MKVIVFDNDSLQVSQFEKLLYGILGDSMQLYKNPSLNWIVGCYDEYENALFFIDTRYKVSGGNFLTLARRIRENSEKCHICFLAPSTADIAFCYKKLVRPSGFLLKPVDENELRLLISDIIRFENARRSLPDDPQILLKTRGARSMVVPATCCISPPWRKKWCAAPKRTASCRFTGRSGRSKSGIGSFSCDVTAASWSTAAASTALSNRKCACICAAVNSKFRSPKAAVGKWRLMSNVRRRM